MTIKIVEALIDLALYVVKCIVCAFIERKYATIEL